MMKKLLFSLFLMIGTGVLSSCQQDEVVNEVPANKGVTIRASLPNDAQSRVTFGDSYSNNDTNYRSVSWKKGDEIKVEINQIEYTFTATEDGKTATFICNDSGIPSKLPEGQHLFTYGTDIVEISPNSEQNGTDLTNYYMEAQCFSQNDGTAWDQVELKFEAKSNALVEINLGNIQNVTNVSMHKVDGTCLVRTSDKTDYTKKSFYFSVPQGNYDVYFVVTTKNGEQEKFYSYKVPQIYLETKIYKVTFPNTSAESNVQYKSIGNTLYVYGYGKIPAEYFKAANNGGSGLASFGPTVVILDGITGIGNNAFTSRSNLTSVTIPASVTSIGESAFANCGNVTYTFKGNTAPSLGSSALGSTLEPTINANENFRTNASENSTWDDYMDNFLN